ncbi:MULTISPECIES: hypothetical protein [Streptomyces]|uniref:hypothetical protein n=1 Tax=Streptomyces TaxID=1883 RepID=UPI001673FC77|nr:MULTISPECIES: hypothetical protein [Streptomyces]MBD3574805.1 hypothetical protein [Streptomyces sp. KD18]GGS84183.1 hypothetical protein GCM10010286_06090 [Streptomyces toxytricini]
MARFRKAAAALAAGCSAALLTGLAPAGNGIEDESPRAIVDKARTELTQARSVHMVAHADGEKGATTLDLRFDVDGNCAGSVSLPRGGGRAEIVKRGQDIWVKPDGAFLRSQVPAPAADGAAALIGDRWLHGTSDNVLLRKLTDVCDLKDFQRAYASRLTTGQLRKGGPATVGGTPAVTVTGTRGGDTATFYVATEGEPRLLRLEGREDGRSARADFLEYGAPVPARTPPPGESVDISELR